MAKQKNGLNGHQKNNNDGKYLDTERLIYNQALLKPEAAV